MKRSTILISIMALLGAMGVRAEDAIPKQAEFSRYDGMLKHSPFAVATAPAPLALEPSWAKDLYVANAAHTSQLDLVTIMSVSDKNLKEYLTTEKPNDHGYGIANIEWSDDPAATKVTISKDGQFATIGFNEALASQSNTGLPNPNPMMQAKGFGQGPQLPPVPVTMPHTRGVIQRNPNQYQKSKPLPVQPMAPFQSAIPGQPAPMPAQQKPKPLN